ncbi:MAG: hypothetical protein ABL904_27105 [Hyphomicrobiaceae bacterium]
MREQSDGANAIESKRAEVSDFSITSNPAFNKHLPSLPSEGQLSFNPEQLSILSRATNTPPASHIIDFRASTRILRNAFYIRIIFGRERRNADRLRTENQISLAKSIALIAVIGWLVTTAAVIVALLVTYGIKSTIGIDLFDGASLFHGLFYEGP